MDSSSSSFERYRDLQDYVGWATADRDRIHAAAHIVEPYFPALVEDFYAELQRHPGSARTITGGARQIERLKQTLVQWLRELFSGQYDEAYVARRWRVGLRHVEIGLPQIYTAAALSRLRNGIMQTLRDHWTGDDAGLFIAMQSLNKLLDLDLAVIGDAYDTDHVRRQREAERRRLDDLLHREKELSSGLLTYAQAAVLVLDQRGFIVRCNPFAQALAAGFLDGDLENRDWFELFLEGEDRVRTRASLLNPSQESPSTFSPASMIIDRDGRRRQLHWTGTPLKDGAGEPFGVVVIGHDVSDLFEAQQRALQAERLAAIGQMATGLAHESRNSLQRIGASAEMLELELEDKPAALELVARIQQSKGHLHRLLEEVRNYAAPIILDKSPIRISEAWREAWALLTTQRRGRDVELREDIQSDRLIVEVDRFRIVQVFRNLLDNALAAGKDPVRITITCEPARLGSLPAIRVSVRDNGRGLDTEQRRRIFEPFYTTKPTGTGLGTAIAQRLVEAHGGTITVGDCPPPGTELVVVLPCG